jgi:hypothetical protein
MTLRLYLTGRGGTRPLQTLQLTYICDKDSTVPLTFNDAFCLQSVKPSANCFNGRSQEVG